MTAHAKLSASGSEMWLNCAGSINAQIGYESKTSRHALEGTFAHEVADICLTDKIAPFSMVGSVICISENEKSYKHTIKKEMADYVQQYIDYIKLYQTAESILYTENKVDFSNIVPDGFGTLDSAVYRPEDNTLHIFDLKYGKGVEVTAEKNTQGMLYALGMINDMDWIYDFNDIVIHIVQPRIPSFTHYKTTKTELLEWSKYVSERANLALTDNAPRTAGEKQCLWCLAKNDCETLKKYRFNQIVADFD